MERQKAMAPQAKRKTYKDLRAGALFNIPLPRGRIALGQIVRPGVEFYMCAYLPALPRDNSPTPPMESLSPVLCCLTTDAPFYHGRWTLRGRAPIHPEVPYPHFFVNDYRRGPIIEDVDGKLVRKAKPRDQETIPLRTNVGEENVTDVLEAMLDSKPLPEDSEHMLAELIRRWQ
jgi:hypothetical protein